MGSGAPHGLALALGGGMAWGRYEYASGIWSAGGCGTLHGHGISKFTTPNRPYVCSPHRDQTSPYRDAVRAALGVT